MPVALPAPMLCDLSTLGDINDLKESVSELKQNNLQTNIGYIGIGLGIAGIILASIAISKTKKS